MCAKFHIAIALHLQFLGHDGGGGGLRTWVKNGDVWGESNTDTGHTYTSEFPQTFEVIDVELHCVPMTSGQLVLHCSAPSSTRKCGLGQHS